MREDKINLGALIEQYRVFVGGFLLVLVIASGGLLIYQKNSEGLSIDDKIKMLEGRIEELEKEKPVPIETTVAASPPQSAPELNQARPVTPMPEAPASQKTAVGTSKSAAEKINVNTASLQQLDSLPGIGQTYAKRIIEYREANGGFKSVDELTNVKGIGPKTLEKFKDRVIVE